MQYTSADIQLIRAKFGIKSKRRAKFALEYIANDGNGRQAAIAAGYPPKHAHAEATRLLKTSSIQNAMEWARQGDDTKPAIINELRAITEEARLSGQFSPAVKAVELRGRHVGMWQDKTDHGPSVTFIIKGLDSPPGRVIDGELAQDSADQDELEDDDSTHKRVGVMKSMTYEPPE